MDSYNEFSDRADWDRLGLDHTKFEMSFFNQEEDYADSLRGEWWAMDDERTDGLKIIYGGSFGNDNSPGASMYTWAEVYQADEHDAFYARVKELEGKPEFLPSEDELDPHDIEDGEMGNACGYCHECDMTCGPGQRTCDVCGGELTF